MFSAHLYVDCLLIQLKFHCSGLLDHLQGGLTEETYVEGLKYVAMAGEQSSEVEYAAFEFIFPLN